MQKTSAIIPILLFLLCSCSREGQMMTRLTEIDSLSFHNPDSAYNLLNNMGDEVKSHSKEVSMYYDLLRIQTSYKTFHQQTSDSLIMQVVDYYEQGADLGKLAQAYFYAGCVYSDVDAASKRNLYYIELAQHCDTAWINSYWLSRIFAQKGYIYLRAGLFEDALEMQQLARMYCTQIGDTAGVRYSTEDMATIEKMRQSAKRDTASMLALRQAYAMTIERAHNKLLRMQNERQQKSNEEGKNSNRIPLVVLVGILLTAIGAWVIQRRRKADIIEQTANATAEDPIGSQESPSPTRRAFYDAEVDALLQSRLKADKVLKPVDWKFIEERILATYPDFRSHLYSLYELSETEYHICLLIKTQTSPSHMARLLAMGPSSVSQSRLRMQQKVFGERGTAKDWDTYVQSI